MGCLHSKCLHKRFETCYLEKCIASSYVMETKFNKAQTKHRL